MADFEHLAAIIEQMRAKQEKVEGNTEANQEKT
jgi:hypothetical protein